jgi:lipopolysaccharide export LptBFGC system permease protein LptF
MIASALALAGVILFALLWIGLGNAGLGNLPRLVLALCLPPAVIAVLLGGYVLVRGRGN